MSNLDFMVRTVAVLPGLMLLFSNWMPQGIPPKYISRNEVRFGGRNGNPAQTCATENKTYE